MATTEAFEKAYKGLNAEQKLAVDTVEGPVLVIAGPGTGKTHILTLRIANILLQTSAKPEEILVLTFTDSAARTIARRLGTLVGEETARKVGVFTFHSFAEEVLKRHPEVFAEYTDRRQMGEVEQVLLWRSVLETHGVPSLRTAKSPFHYLKDLKDLEDDMTRERISVEEYRTWLDEESKRIEAEPTLRYVRGGKGGAAGDLKPEGLKRLERIEKGRDAARLIEIYREEKEKRGLYGFTDVLRIAVDGLATDEALRADLQEQYQYILADEHQDANALQHGLLDALAFDDHPNLFIVGDEKQAIFGFQGADATHFKTFLAQYPRTAVVTLVENYRSYQEVLDLSHGLLSELPSAAGAHVPLVAARGQGADIHLLAANDPLAERDQVATLVEQAIKTGTKPHEIALITRWNRTADLFALHLRARGIPVLRAGNIDLEGRPVVRFFLALMRAVADPNDVASLREALVAPWWKEALSERLLFLRQHADYELLNALKAAFLAIANLIGTLQEQAIAVPPVNMLSLILKDSNARAYLLSHTESLEEDIPLMRQLIMHIEDLARRAPNATFAEVIDELTKAQEHEIGSIKTSLTEREGCVTVITAHKAKGMEFERVFVTALTAREWEGRGRSALIPSPFDTERERGELVRLFYVALTRAKNSLVLSYAAANAEGKEQSPFSLLPAGLAPVAVPADPLPLLHVVPSAPKLVQELTERYLLHDGLSPSAYNEYLESPAAFFAKRVLRLREPESRAIVLGNAVHAALAQYLGNTGESNRDSRTAEAHATIERSIRKSLLPRGDTFETLRQHSHALLEAALTEAFFSREVLEIEKSFGTKRVVGGKEVLLKGSVDALVSGTQGECIVDFKTSSTIDKTDREKFERQIAFYDLLLRENGYAPDSGLIVQLSEEGTTEYPVTLTDDMRQTLAATLDEVIGELLSGQWRKGEASEYDALLELLKD
jgi:DNA helicase-2/ATP-dependent DNA helicase PcrA